jgi:hypothetical protein
MAGVEGAYPLHEPCVRKTFVVTIGVLRLRSSFLRETATPLRMTASGVVAASSKMQGPQKPWTAKDANKRTDHGLRFTWPAEHVMGERDARAYILINFYDALDPD